MESGLELVLDNRKLIVFFLVLISIIGGFFVFGYKEGKRQGYLEGSQAAAVLVPNADSEGAPLPETAAGASTPDSSADSGDVEDQPLDWYKKVNRPEKEAEIEPPPARKTEAAPLKSPIDAPAGYSVQVGAFRQKREAEVKAQTLKSKGFDSRIEAPQNPDQLYLLKVGNYDSRADAVAMQLRLKKSGFPSFIKTN